MLKNYFIIITVALFTATSFSPEGKVIGYSYPEVKKDTVSVGDCRPCLGYVINQVNPSIWYPQIDTVTNKMRINIDFKVDSTEVNINPQIDSIKKKKK